MTVYNVVAQALSEWCNLHGYALRAEHVSVDGSVIPNRYLLFSVIADVDTEWYADARARTRYLVQIDLVPEIGCEVAALASDLDDMDDLLAGSGFVPQGNRTIRMDKETHRLYAQKDYYVYMGRG